MPEFAPGQIVTVFRSRLRPENEDGYHPVAAEMGALAQTMPGLIEVKGFIAEDGERVTLVTFADEESQRNWREHPDHRVAQARGRQEFYAEYSLQVCTTTRARGYRAPRPSSTTGPSGTGPSGTE